MRVTDIDIGEGARLHFIKNCTTKAYWGYNYNDECYAELQIRVGKILIHEDDNDDNILLKIPCKMLVMTRIVHHWAVRWPWPTWQWAVARAGGWWYVIVMVVSMSASINPSRVWAMSSGAVPASVLQAEVGVWLLHCVRWGELTSPDLSTLQISDLAYINTPVDSDTCSSLQSHAALHC